MIHISAYITEEVILFCKESLLFVKISRTINGDHNKMNDFVKKQKEKKIEENIMSRYLLVCINLIKK